MNPYESPEADEPVEAELKSRPLFDRLLLVSAPLTAGLGFAGVFDCVRQENYWLAVVFAAGAAYLLWTAWRWSR